MPLALLHHASSSLRRQPDMLIQLQRFLKNESGAAAIEYGLLSSGIAVAIIPSGQERRHPAGPHLHRPAERRLGANQLSVARPWLGSADKTGSSGSCGRVLFRRRVNQGLFGARNDSWRERIELCHQGLQVVAGHVIQAELSSAQAPSPPFPASRWRKN
jgi:Flp/Fap pilin component